MPLQPIQPTQAGEEKSGHASLVYGAGIVAAFLVPWLALPENWFLRVALLYVALALGTLLVICILGMWRQLFEGRKSSKAVARSSKPSLKP